MASGRRNIYRSTVHWRYAMARSHLLFFDSRLIFLLILFAFHIRWWKSVVLLVEIVAVSRAIQFKHSLADLLRRLLSKPVEPLRPATAYTRLRPMVDYVGDAVRSKSPKSTTDTISGISR